MIPHRVHKAKQRKKAVRVDPHLLARLEAQRSESSIPATSRAESAEVEDQKNARPNVVHKPDRAKDKPKSLKNVGIHPLLLGRSGTASTGADQSGSQKKRRPQDILKNTNKRGFDVNPYFDQTSLDAKPHRRELKFNEQGKYIARANEIREQEKLEHEAALEKQELAKQGLVPDVRFGEDLYQLQPPPSVEWWDQPYLRDRHYQNLEDKSRLIYMEMSEDNPISHYIQFPALPVIGSGNSTSEVKLYLTKKELKKKRRVERLIKHKSLQENIRAGLIAPPPPKVKLKNLMSVLTNDAIKDPTALELRIKSEVAERALQHEKANQDRKLTPEERAVKVKERQEVRLQREGIVCSIFKVSRGITNMYKANVNAVQLGLKGCTLSLAQSEDDANPPGAIIVEGDYKNVDKYTRLLCERVDWTKTKSGDAVANNKCEVISRFKEQDFKFHKWFNKSFATTDEIMKFLTDQGIENYYRLLFT